MPTTFHLPLPARNPSPPAFPKRCVGCGAAPDTESRMLKRDAALELLQTPTLS